MHSDNLPYNRAWSINLSVQLSFLRIFYTSFSFLKLQYQSSNSDSANIYHDVSNSYKPFLYFLEIQHKFQTYAYITLFLTRLPTRLLCKFIAANPLFLHFPSFSFVSSLLSLSLSLSAESANCFAKFVAHRTLSPHPPHLKFPPSGGSWSGGRAHVQWCSAPLAHARAIVYVMAAELSA